MARVAICEKGKVVDQLQVKRGDELNVIIIGTSLIRDPGKEVRLCYFASGWEAMVQDPFSKEWFPSPSHITYETQPIEDFSRSAT